MKLCISIILPGGGHWSGMAWNVYRDSLDSGLRGDEGRKEDYMLSWDSWELCWWNIE